ncbi:MAG: PAS domain S-box protein [Aureispira sp.]
MPHRDSEDYKAQAIRKWERTYKTVVTPPQDIATLKQLLKEAQIAQLALSIENAQLKKKGLTYSAADAAALRLLLAVLPKSVFIKDIQDDYRVLFWNNQVGEFMGVVVDEATGKTDHELFPEDIATVIRRLDRQAAEESLQQPATTYISKATFYGIQRSVIKDSVGEPLFLVGSITKDASTLGKGQNLQKQKIEAIHDLEHALNQSTLILVLDEHKKIISANDNFYRHTGYQLEDLLGRHFDMTDPSYHSKWSLKLIWETTEKGQIWKGKLKCKTQQGAYYWADTAVVPFMDEEQQTNKYIILQYEITSRKEMEGELERNNEAAFTKLYQQQRYIREIEEHRVEWDRCFQRSTEMISVMDVDGLILRVNPAFAKVLGYVPKDLIGGSVFDFIHPDDAEKSQEANHSIKDSIGVVNFVNRWRTFYGGYRWISWKAVVDKETKISYCITRDVTEERLASQRVKDFNHTLHQTTLVLVLDAQEEIIAVNQKFCEVSGFQEKEVLGRTYGSLGDKQLEEELWSEIQTALQEGKLWQGEVRERKKNNVVYWTYTSIVPFLEAQGTPYQYIVTQADITSRKHLEEKLREAKKEADKNAKIKEDFLTNMSHEIRTPMNGVLGFSRLLLQTKMTHLQHEYAQSIYSSAENLLVIVNDILDVSKIESGTFQLKESIFDLQKRMEESLSILKVSVQKKSLIFNIHIDPKIPRMILGVPDRLSQVLINLVGNAIKFTKKGTIVLSVSLYNNRLLFKVTDTGIGIPEDKLESIFESFTQAENCTTRAYSGTGLGLSISKKLVHLMGGQIGVESKLNQGSTFFFSLPFKGIDEPQEQQPTSYNSIARPNADLPLILVVEDNKVNQELVLIYLNLLECDCHIAENGLAALSYMQQYQYDLILMDIQMPTMDGMAATSVIRKINNSIPIIAMSAHALEREKKRCFEIGMNDYIAKPFKVEGLQEIMTKYIRLPSQKEQSAVPRIQYLDNNATPSQTTNPVFLSSYTNVRISKELLILFKEELLKLEHKMEDAFKTGQIQPIQRQMHRIKPNFELFDLVQFYEWSNAMETLAINKASMIEIQAIYEEMKAALPALMERIEKEIQH